MGSIVEHIHDGHDQRKQQRKAKVAQFITDAGHGIGLSIASAIVSAHNGQIHASQPSPGSLRIAVTLPRRQKQTFKR